MNKCFDYNVIKISDSNNVIELFHYNIFYLLIKSILSLLIKNNYIIYYLDNNIIPSTMIPFVYDNCE